MLNKKQAVSFLKNNPAFLFLLPVFFVLHGCVLNFNSVPVTDAILLTMVCLSVASLLAAMAWFFYQDFSKAAIFAFFGMAYHFFFGNLQDFLKSISIFPFVAQYRFIFPVSLLLFILLITGLKKRKKPLYTFCSYLNTLLLILLVLDAGWLVAKMVRPGGNTLLHPGTAMLQRCDTCHKPDIYLVLADQYAGSKALEDVFNFDNSEFLNELGTRGFQVAKNSSSNYNLTPFSMASLLNMDYLTGEMGEKKHLNVSYTYRLIKNSRVVQYLMSNGYQFYNYSVFDFPGFPAHKYRAFLPYGTQLITGQTLTGRLDRDIRSAIIEGKLGSVEIQKKIIYENLHFNDSIFAWTGRTAVLNTDQPKFVYSHLMIPHHPYYFDSKGDSLPLRKLLSFKNTTSGDYIEYLRYGNKKILELIDTIQRRSPTPPVIMLLSDHGFRHPAKTMDRRYDFMNLNAICLPGENDNSFTDSLTNVNFFRVFFNSCFDQHLILLKDSTVDLWD